MADILVPSQGDGVLGGSLLPVPDVFKLGDERGLEGGGFGRLVWATSVALGPFLIQGGTLH